MQRHANQPSHFRMHANPINFTSISVSGPLQIVILIYWPCVQKMEVVTIFYFLPHCVTSTISRMVWFGKVRSMENAIGGDHGKSFASAACKSRQPPYLHPGSPLNQKTHKCTSTTSTQKRRMSRLVRWDGFLKKTMEKRSQRRVKWWLLRPCYCDLMPHCFVICDKKG